jgi:diguanylate cyclase (GGDEF)-like protein
LIVDDQEWTARTLESILSPSGYAVLKAYNGKQALELARRVTPDLFLVDLHLPDTSGADLCKQLRELPTVTRATPILVHTPSPVIRQERIEALWAGAWEVIRLPLDPEELVLKVGAFVGAKQEADLAREESLLDPATGFYNVKGLLRRVSEVTADASRYKRALACVVVGPETVSEAERAAFSGEGEGDSVLAELLFRAFTTVTRTSDTIGRLGAADFVVVAPGTDPLGAFRLAERILDAAKTVSEGHAAAAALANLRAGFFALSDAGSASIIPGDLLRRATQALRRTQSDRAAERILAYQEN